ncbi:MAG: hypothetical protein CMG55_03670 [Candidatus Marinimicrobia bacterium]|nr:hypothetical protein [Candidatus Neomarinimicrobiota bacterium]|tara:strand:+ start:565 stop:1272 length:708 start_codon:yes stop_codon:yes gene_type:complete
MIPDKAFYINKNDINSGLFFLNKAESHHIIKVVKLQLGDVITLLDGQGSGYFATIEKFESNCVFGIIDKKIENLGENKSNINIAPAILKKNRFEILLEKVTELGVKEIHPIIMDRSVKKTINMDRCNQIIISAAKQCRRSFFPILHQPKKLLPLLQNKKYCNFFAGNLETDQYLNEFDLTKDHPYYIIIGPEGGFTKPETELMISKDVVQFSLGNRRLRSETATIAALSILNRLR